MKVCMRDELWASLQMACCGVGEEEHTDAIALLKL